MKTNAYDLNLYVLNGELKIVAYQLMKDRYGFTVTNHDKWLDTIKIDVFRGNERKWRPFLDLFREPELYSELDSWIYAYTYPNHKYMISQIKLMPIELALALQELPEYELHDANA